MSRFQRGNNGDHPTPDEEKRLWPKHGAYACVKLYQERQLDLRRADHRFLFEWKQNLISDLGGAKEINVFQSAMVDQAVSLLIILNKMSEYVEEKGIMEGDQLTACLRSSYLQYCNTLRHCLSAAYEVAKKKSKKMPRLEDYLKQKEREEDDQP